MCRCSDMLLNCVSTYIERSPEFRQLLIGISTMRYLPPSGTAGLARSLVNGNKRVPAPPPMMMAKVRWVVPGGSSAGVDIGETESRGVGVCVCTMSNNPGSNGDGNPFGTK